jgi:hypothetical protein
MENPETNVIDESILKKQVLLRARCAMLAKHLMEHPASLAAIEMAEQFGLGNIELAELIKFSERALDAHTIIHNAYFAVAERRHYCEPVSYDERDWELRSSAAYLAYKVSSVDIIKPISLKLESSLINEISKMVAVNFASKASNQIIIDEEALAVARIQDLAEDIIASRKIAEQDEKFKDDPNYIEGVDDRIFGEGTSPNADRIYMVHREAQKHTFTLEFNRVKEDITAQCLEIFKQL